MGPQEGIKAQDLSSWLALYGTVARTSSATSATSLALPAPEKKSGRTDYCTRESYLDLDVDPGCIGLHNGQNVEFVLFDTEGSS